MAKFAEVTRSLRLQKPVDRLALIGRIFRSCFALSSRAGVAVQAASLAYTTVLSIAPLLAVLFYVFKAFGGFDYAYSKLQPFIIQNLSEGTGDVVAQYLETFIHRVHAKAVGWAGIAGLFITSVLAYLNIARAFQQIWQTEKAPPLLDRVARALLLIAVGPPLAVASLAVTAAISAQLKNIPFSGHFFALVLNWILYAIVYSLIPPVRVSLSTVLRGSILPAILWELAKSGYAIYTKKIVTYSTFYGSLAAVPLFLFWVYIAWYITLFGAAWIRTLQLNRIKPAV